MRLRKHCHHFMKKARYRFLRSGTVLRKGDQYLAQHNNRWMNTERIGQSVISPGYYRRKLNTK